MTVTSAGHHQIRTSPIEAVIHSGRVIARYSARWCGAVCFSSRWSMYSRAV